MVTPRRWADFVPAAIQRWPSGHPLSSTPSPSNGDLQEPNGLQAPDHHLESLFHGTALNFFLWRQDPLEGLAGD